MTAHLTRVRSHLVIHAHRKVRGQLEGDYAAVAVGRGMDFNDLREYVPGDEVKDIDWKASARSRQLLVRRYVAERKHAVHLCVSTGRSMAALNDAQVAKRELAVFVAGVVGQLAVQHGDLVGLSVGDAGDLGSERAAGGLVHLERLLGRVHEAIRPTGSPSDLEALLRHVVRTVRRRTILLVVADDVALTPGTEALLRRLAVQHEVLLLTVGDVDPTDPGVAGRRLVDIDTAAEVPAWARDDAQLRREYAALVQAEVEQLRRQLDRLGVVHERVHDHASAVVAVHRLLERHRHARRR